MSNGKPSGASDEVTGPATPEDVAILYSWANLPGAKYRDFSASRREYRAQQRARQAEDQRQAELASARALEEAASRELEQAQRALERANQAEQEAADAEAKQHAEELFRIAEANVHREQQEAQRRQQSAETLRLRAQSARKEMMDARKRAEEQAARYAEYDALYRAQVEERGEEPPGQLDDPYYYTGQVDPAYFASTPGVRTAQAARTSTERKAYVFPVHPGSDEFDAGTLQAYRPGTNFAPSPAQEYRSFPGLRDRSSVQDKSFQRLQPSEQERHSGRDVDDAEHATADNDYYSKSGRGLQQGAPSTSPFDGVEESERDLHIRPRALRSSPDGLDPLQANDALTRWRTTERQPGQRSRRNAPADDRARTVRQPRSETSGPPRFNEADHGSGGVPPAWLASAEQPEKEPFNSFGAADKKDSVARNPSAGVTLPIAPDVRFSEAKRARTGAADARFEGEHVGITEPDVLSQRFSPAPDTLQQSRERVASRWFALQGLMEEDAELQEHQTQEPTMPVPVLSLISLSGGVGKTSLVATLGRALSSLGEKVLLADTNTHGLLPYYFGARDLRPGAIRTFTPPPGSSDAPVLMAHYELDRIGNDEGAQDMVVTDLTERAGNVQRVLVDLSSRGMWLAQRLAYSSPFVLVPLAPDMNSILGTQTMEHLFAGVRDIDGKPVRPYYVLNQYDPALPLHLDVREVLRQSLGERLLPIMIHRAPAVSEALAEGMTVIDYAPGSAVTEDYKGLAHWIQTLAAAGTSVTRGARWSER